MSFTKLFLMGLAGSVYEIATGRSFTQRLIRRKVGNALRRIKGQPPLRSWEDGRVNTPKRSPVPSAEESARLIEQAVSAI